jgi:tRNA(Ser,Leu) C12 N-acetylase TAN1
LIESKVSNVINEVEDLKQDLMEIRQVVQGQDDTKIDADNITDQVLEQIKPDIENLNEVTAQIS